MAFVQNQNAQIYWNSIGKGEPIVLVMGLGCSSAMWFRVVPRLARKYRVILLDNRGAGQTNVDHFVVHRVSNMATDITCVLDAAGESSAHVLGFSMGGMIAQQLAIDYPDRVRSLILVGTNCGGISATLAKPKVWRRLFDKGSRTPEENLRQMQAYTYAGKTPLRLIDEDQAIRLASFPTLRGYQAQLYGLMGWTSYSKLNRITCPTLVVHGVEDQLIPPVNGQLLADRIDGAHLVQLDNASHWLHTDQTERFIAAVRRHLVRHSKQAALGKARRAA